MGLFELFGPSKDAIWRQVADEIGADVHQGGFFGGAAKVVATHGEWTITLDTFSRSTGNNQSKTFTRFRAPYVNADGFRFNIYRANFLSGFGSALGFQDVVVGFPEFDDAFVIKGNDDAKLRRLFANATVRDLLEQQSQVHFQVKPDQGWFGRSYPDGVDELNFTVGGVLTDPDALRLLFDLFAETLEQLCRIGSAYEDDPNVQL